MSFNSIEDILDFAAGKEEEAVVFYKELSTQADFTAMKEALEDFSHQEQKHYDLILNFKNNKAKLDEYNFKWIPDLKRSDYVVDITYEKGMPYTDILRLAMKREEKALKLYDELIEKADAEDLVKLFKVLAQEEAKHKNILETMYDDYMAKQGD